MNLTYKRATLEDIDILVKTRIEVLKAANKLCVDTDMGEVERQSYSYYQKGSLRWLSYCVFGSLMEVVVLELVVLVFFASDADLS